MRGEKSPICNLLFDFPLGFGAGGIPSLLWRKREETREIGNSSNTNAHCVLYNTVSLVLCWEQSILSERPLLIGPLLSLYCDTLAPVDSKWVWGEPICLAGEKLLSNRSEERHLKNLLAKQDFDGTSHLCEVTVFTSKRNDDSLKSRGKMVKMALFVTKI